jgi:hypothetical protein
VWSGGAAAAAEQQEQQQRAESREQQHRERESERAAGRAAAQQSSSEFYHFLLSVIAKCPAITKNLRLHAITITPTQINSRIIVQKFTVRTVRLYYLIVVQYTYQKVFFF